MEKNKKHSIEAIFLFLICIIAVILTSIFWCKVPVVPVCMIVLLEVLLAVCMHGMPLGVHMMVMMAQVIIGTVCGQFLFVVLCVVVYLAAVLTLGTFHRKD